MKQYSELKFYKRASELYLRALWNKGFAINSLPVVHGKSDPLSYLDNQQLYLPDKIFLDELNPFYYRAAATHAACHVIYGGQPFDSSDYNFMQREIIGLVEDLRVELQAIKQFPGLRRLWLQFHNIENENSISARQLMLRLSQSILDASYNDEHQWVKKGKALILHISENNKLSEAVIETGLKLANDLGQMRLPLNSGRYEQAVKYRDDNRCLWHSIIESRNKPGTTEQQEDDSLRNNQLVEASQGLQLKISDFQHEHGEGLLIEQKQAADFIYLLHDETQQDFNFKYPEWDYRIHTLKQDWCSLQEQLSPAGSAETVEKIKNQHRLILARLRYIASKVRIEKQQRVRRLEEGDEIDLDPMINAMVATRSNTMPDTRVFMRNDLVEDKELAISILLDLSESTNQLVSGSSIPISELLRDAVLLLGETLSVAGEHFSISGFSSNGRHQVKVINFKLFNEPFVSGCSRLTNITGNYSTRLGTAIRHCAQGLSQQPSRKKLLLVITDGIPSDIDVYDSKYLVEDSWHAVHNLYQYGISPFCLNLDSKADSTTEHIFGDARYMTIDNLARLPEALSYIYIKYLRH